METADVKAGRAIMSVLFPPVGFVTWVLVKTEYPEKAKSYLALAVIGTILYAIGQVSITVKNVK